VGDNNVHPFTGALSTSSVPVNGAKVKIAPATESANNALIDLSLDDFVDPIKKLSDLIIDENAKKNKKKRRKKCF
jgi:hypothetical protein